MSVGADDFGGPELDALHRDVLGRLSGANDQDPLSGKVPGVPEIMSVKNPARKC